MAYFEYPVPHNLELREIYKSPYRFTDELRAHVDYVFSHPTLKQGIFYANNKTEWSSNIMLKVAYINLRYVMDNLSQYGGAIENAADTVVFRMWMAFIAELRYQRQAYSGRFIIAPMRVMFIGNGMLLDKIIEDIVSENYMKDAPVARKPKGKRKELDFTQDKDNIFATASKQLVEGDAYFEHLCGLE